MTAFSVFGIGYVGVVAAACLARDGHTVVAVDVDPAKVAAVAAGRSPIVEPGLDALVAETVACGRLTATLDANAAVAATDVSLVAVGTPPAPDGSVSLEQVAAVCKTIGRAIARKAAFHSVILRSTMVPGSTEGTCIPALEAASGKAAGTGFGVGYFPEFLRESTAIADYDDPGLIVYAALDDRTRSVLAELNTALPAHAHVVDMRTAEMVKYTSNSWRALKITFANEIGNIAKASGADGQTVMEILCSDTKIAMSPAFLRPGFAFGGSCLPKDVRALRHHAEGHDTRAPLLTAILEANAAQIARAERMVHASGASRVGLVGISFKAGTDDLRESPLAELAGRLIRDGIDIAIFDPFVSEAQERDIAGTGRGNSVVPDLAGRLVDDLDELIASSDAIVVGNTYPDAMETLRAAARVRPTIDLARVDRSCVSGAAYQGICW